MSLPSVCASPNAGVRIWGLLWRAEVVSSADVARLLVLAASTLGNSR